jgi:hypothetical protein
MSKCILHSDLPRSSDNSVSCDTTIIDESVLSSLSLDTGPFPSVLSNFQNLAISNFQTSSLISTASPPSLSHNLASIKKHTMESDCEENLSGQLKTEALTSTSNEILTMLSAISSQMMVSHQDLQQQNSLLSAELQKVIVDTNNFKREMRDELLRLQQPSVSLSSTPVVSNVLPPPVASSGGTTISPQGATSNTQVSPSLSSGSTSSMDFQTQMLTMLTNTFIQLTTVINETKTVIGETKHSDS